MSIKRIAPLVAALAGAMLGLYSLAEFAGGSIPYQDPTSAMLIKQQAELHSAEMRIYAGISVFILGLVIALLQFLQAKRPKSASPAA